MTVRDEVCGMEFPVERAAASVQFGGRTYHFCAERCRRLFLAHPHWYVKVAPEVKPPA
jgi:P-type Cu+ transporter